MNSTPSTQPGGLRTPITVHDPHQDLTSSPHMPGGYDPRSFETGPRTVTTGATGCPRDPALAALWMVVATVADPEIPVISIADLGILRSVRLDGDTAVITITPTYSGCPAMDTIASDVTRVVQEAGYCAARVEFALSPAWTTEWITPEGRQALADYGIAPPRPRSARAQGPVALTLGRPPSQQQQAGICCPRCGSVKTQEVTAFGSTSCKALYTCMSCHEPFDYFKEH